jgi:hypothetical protein
MKEDKRIEDRVKLGAILGFLAGSRKSDVAYDTLKIHPTRRCHPPEF